MNPLLHWHETNPKSQPLPAPAPKKERATYRRGPKAKSIVYEGIAYKTWAEACAATGKTADAIRWAMKAAK